MKQDKTKRLAPRTKNILRFLHLGWGFFAILPFLPALQRGQAFLFRDLSNIQLPYKATWLAAIAELGRIPHWDPTHAGGFRFVADLNYGPLYPLNWILFGFRSDLPLGLSAFILVHHVLIYCGWFLYLRDLRLRISLAIGGALCFAWLGATVSSQNILHHLCGQAAVGFFLFFWNRALRRDGARWELFAASAALAWPLYGGDPQYSYILGVFALWIWGWARAPWREKGWKLPALLALMVLVAAPQLFPTWDYLHTTGRMLEMQSDEEKLAHSLHPVRLLELVFPLIFGDRPGRFWGTEYLNGGATPFLFSIFVGGAAAALSFLHFFMKIPNACRLKRREWKQVGELLGFGLLLLLALGAYSPVPMYAIALKVLPFWENFRYPERLGYWISALFLLYALVGGEKCFRLPVPKAKKILIPPILVFGAMAIGAIFFAFDEFSARLSLGESIATFVTVLVCLWKRGEAARRDRRYERALIAVMAVDFMIMAHQITWSQPRVLTEAATYPWVGKILADKSQNQEVLGKGGAFRFFSTLQERLNPPISFLPALHEEADTSVYSAWAGMKFNTPSYWGLALVRGHSSLTPSPPVLQLTRASQALAMRVLDLYSTRWLLLMENGTPRAMVNQNALPYVLFPAEAEYIQGETALLERLRSVSWDPKRSVLLERRPGLETSAKPPVDMGKLERRWDEFTITARVSAASPPRWLLVNERFDPGWRVSVNGKDAPFVRANGWALGVELPFLEPGEFTVELRYFDQAYHYGKIAWCVWLLLFTGLFLTKGFRNKEVDRAVGQNAK